MKPVKAGRQETFIDEIVETLRCVPKARLRIVRDVVGALAEPSFSDRNGTKFKTRWAEKPSQNSILWYVERPGQHQQWALLWNDAEVQFGASWRQNLERSS